MSQNSGVRIEALDERTSQNTTYFGVTDDIWEVHYGSNIQIPVFRCRWVKHPKGLDERGWRWLEARKPKIVEGKPKFDRPETEGVADKNVRTCRASKTRKIQTT